LGDPAIKLPEGVGVAVPDHLRCENVSNFFTNFERIGMGSSSVAYRALRLSDDRRVVLKAIRRRGTGEAIVAKREFALLSDLKHPNIIVALDFLESPSCVALVLEDTMGRNLRSVVRSAVAGRLNEMGSMRIFVQAVSALAYLHGRKTVHRDLKPENFIISTGNLLKLIDFNVASSTDGGELLTPVGTREFHAPELLNRPYTSSADVWSVGICLYFMLHGRTPPHSLLTAVPSVASMPKDSDDASDEFSDDDISTPAGPLMRGVSEMPVQSLGSSSWALRRCLHEDQQERATAQEVLAGATGWLSERNERGP
jgi:serine/threonine protein kinase